MASRRFVLEKVSSDGVLLDHDIPEASSRDGLNSCLKPLEILDSKKFAQPAKDLIVRKVGDMWGHLVVEFNIRLHLLSNLTDGIELPRYLLLCFDLLPFQLLESLIAPREFVELLGDLVDSLLSFLHVLLHILRLIFKPVEVLGSQLLLPVVSGHFSFDLNDLSLLRLDVVLALFDGIANKLISVGGGTFLELFLSLQQVLL